jgi:hypothetical protein
MTDILFALGDDDLGNGVASSPCSDVSSLSAAASPGFGESGNDGSCAASFAVEEDEVRLLSSDLDLDLERSVRDCERCISVVASSKVSCAQRVDLALDWRSQPALA